MSLLQSEDARRGASVAAYDLLKAPPRDAFESLARIAAQICNTPMSAVSVQTATEQHHIATIGLDREVCDRDESLFATILHDSAPVNVPDARRDARFADSPFVTGERAAIRFYAGHQLTTRDGVRFGTICVFDNVPRPPLDEGQLATLASLAERVVDICELRLRAREVALAMMEQQAMRAELGRSNERLASFAGQVSHDLKTPLTSLSLTLSLIREQLQEDGRDGADALDLLDRAVSNASRMSHLIDDVLDYARLGGTLKATEVNLSWVLRDVLDDLEDELGGAVVHTGRLPTVLGDRSQLRAVLQNLVANAARYRDPDRPLEVDITARHVQRAWRIEVADNGLGIPIEHHARVFEPLVRVEDSGDGVGIGIGLATCRRIVGAHGGSIGILATPVGSRFWVELPD